MSTRNRPRRPHDRSTVVTVGTTSIRHAFGTNAMYIEIQVDERVAAKLGYSAVTISSMSEASTIAITDGDVIGEVLHDIGKGTAKRTHVAFLASRAGVLATVREWDQAERDPHDPNYYTLP